MPSMRVVVDAMNVIGSRPDGWWRDRDAAMSRLVDSLERWSKRTGDDVTVVFEREPRPPIASPWIEIAYAPAPAANAADDEIVRRLRADPDPASIRVVTSDRALAAHVHELGAAVEPASAFRDRIDST